MAGDEKRKFPRAPIELKVSYKRLNTFFHDYTHNISKGGTFIRTPRPLEIGTEFLFKLTIPDMEEPLTLRGRVQWVVSEEKAAADGEEPGMGIEFLYDTDDELDAVSHTVEKLMTKHLGARAHAKLLGKA